MEDTDGRAVRAVAPMTKEAVLDALKEKLLLDGGGVVANTNSEAYGKWLLLSATNIESIMRKGVKSVAGVVGMDDYGIVRDAIRSLASNKVPDYGKVLWNSNLRYFRISQQNHGEIAYGVHSV